jgi:hypothetical protein
MTSTRPHFTHDGSNADPTKGDHYGIVAIDKWGVEHHSAHSGIGHSHWAWQNILFWRYDDTTMIEMMTWEIATLKDEVTYLRNRIAGGT